jgi:hypothetical protein
VALAALTLATLALVARADAFVYFPEDGIGTIGTGVNLTFISGLDNRRAWRSTAPTSTG